MSNEQELPQEAPAETPAQELEASDTAPAQPEPEATLPTEVPVEAFAEAPIEAPVSEPVAVETVEAAAPVELETAPEAEAEAEPAEPVSADDGVPFDSVANNPAPAPEPEPVAVEISPEPVAAETEATTETEEAPAPVDDGKPYDSVPTPAPEEFANAAPVPAPKPVAETPVADAPVSVVPKTLGNSDASGATVNVKDLKVVGNGDLWQLLCKASSQREGWMKSTKAMEIPRLGCMVQVTTQQINPDGTNECAEALSFVPNVHIVTDVNGGRKLTFGAAE